MKNLTLVLIILFFFSCNKKENHFSKGENLFLITEDDKVGYIDSTGEIVIKPVFFNAGDFSEGLAYARLNGTYGYIDISGEFKIMPQFDYATSFNEGLAIVFNNAKPFFITTRGEKAFEFNYPIAQEFHNGRALVKTQSKKCGIINKEGKLIIDTVYSRINNFIDGLAVVEGINHYPRADPEKGIQVKLEIGVIDTLGNFVIPYGKYKEIEDFKKGYFTVRMINDSFEYQDPYSPETFTAIVDRTGKTIISDTDTDEYKLEGNFNNGFAKITFLTLQEEYSSQKGYVDRTGRILLKNSKYEKVHDFSNNRAFVGVDNSLYLLINTHGKIISKDTFDILEPGFKNGLAFVAKNRKWGLIDTNVNFIITPQFGEIADIGMIDDYFFFKQYYEDERLQGGVYGIAKKDGSVILTPRIDDFDRDGFKNGLLQCRIKGKTTYINKKGDIVWKEIENDSKGISKLNIDFMNRGYFDASSLNIKPEHSRGWGISSNSPQKITNKISYKPNALSIAVNINEQNIYSKAYYGFSVYVINSTTDEIEFNAQDSRLNIKVQALNMKGEWKDIEYLPSSWCGNSYHTSKLIPQFFWTFSTPQYEGDFKTKLRIELKYIDPTDKSEYPKERKEISVYSNEYEASINPGQFWRKNDYQPGGIMDPYFD